MVCVAAPIALSVSETPTPPGPSPSPSMGTQHEPARDLEREKLLLEVEQLEIANSRAQSVWPKLGDAAPLLGFVGAAATLAVTWRKNRRDELAQFRESRRVEEETLRARLSEEFGRAADNLAAKDDRLKAAGAASLAQMQGQGDALFERALIQLVALHLRLGAPVGIRGILVENLLRAVTILAERGEVGVNKFNLAETNLVGASCEGVDLSGVVASLENANLSRASLRKSSMKGLQLREAVLDGADCAGANFGFADLAQVRARGANFGGARFGSANLRGAVLQNVSFRGASLQSAHFEGATLINVDFSHANINDAYFLGANLDAGTRATLEVANNREAAHI